MPFHIQIDQAAIAAFCRKWRITEFALFGSVLRPDFGPHSDVDVLVTFEEDVPWSLWDIVAMQDELSLVFHRKVDLVEKKAIKNPFRRRSILSNYEVIHAA
jgi:predicted nucleotidyltransferase